MEKRSERFLLVVEERLVDGLLQSAPTLLIKNEKDTRKCRKNKKEEEEEEEEDQQQQTEEEEQKESDCFHNLVLRTRLIYIPFSLIFIELTKFDSKKQSKMELKTDSFVFGSLEMETKESVNWQT